jgi:hypothetical protein
LPTTNHYPPTTISSRILLDFSTDEEIALFQPIDDVVMGGVSRSSFTRAEPGIARFSGLVSLENYGGFASVRTRARHWPTADARAFLVRVLGDGHTYKFTVRVDDAFDGLQYQARFTPPAGRWETIRLPVDSFAATFRGRAVAGAPALQPAAIRMLGLMISDKQAGEFELLVGAVEVETGG